MGFMSNNGIWDTAIPGNGTKLVQFLTILPQLNLDLYENKWNILTDFHTTFKSVTQLATKLSLFYLI